MTDQDAQVISKARDLSTLLVDGTSITDEAMKYFARLPNLTTLRLTHTKVTAAGVAALQKALPNCKIEWDDLAKASMPAQAAAGKK